MKVFYRNPVFLLHTIPYGSLVAWLLRSSFLKRHQLVRVTRSLLNGSYQKHLRDAVRKTARVRTIVTEKSEQCVLLSIFKGLWRIRLYFLFCFCFCFFFPRIHHKTTRFSYPVMSFIFFSLPCIYFLFVYSSNCRKNLNWMSLRKMNCWGNCKNWRKNRNLKSWGEENICWRPWVICPLRLWWPWALTT